MARVYGRFLMLIAVLVMSAAVPIGINAAQQVGNAPPASAETPETPASSQQTQPSVAARSLAKGRVFLDSNGDECFGEDESPLPGIRVSNGKEIVLTDDAGQWQLPWEEDAIFFLIKPRGYQSKLSENQLPQFFYVHKPNGSPKLRYPGSKPTGALPQSIDFPLYRVEEPDDFRMLLFGDPQPRNQQEVDYIAHDVIEQLIGNSEKATFGVTLGDIAFDHLNTFETLNQAIALIGIPWHNVIGNHDINVDAIDRKHVNETFEATYGPTYYSFDYGPVHFVVLDNIDWQLRAFQKKFVPNFGQRQLAFLERDLELIDDSQMLVLLMHVPFLDCEDHQSVFRLIEDRPLCVSVSAHRHVHEHQFFGKKQGWNGAKEHHHIVNVTVSGSWWSGAKNDRGIPHATMTDGAPNGYSVMSFVDGDYRLDFRGAGISADEQMLIQFPDKLTLGTETDFMVNVFNGSAKSTVEFAIDDSKVWAELSQKAVADPNFVRMRNWESQVNPPIEPKLSKPRASSHLWLGTLTDSISTGTHLLRVRTTDMHGKVYYGQRSFRVTE